MELKLRHRSQQAISKLRPEPAPASHPARAAGAGLILAAIGSALAWTLPSGSVSHGHPAVPWYLLAVLFGIAEISVLHVQMRGGARTVSLSEAPLILGLFFTGPPGLLLARLLGPLLVFAFIRRQSAVKLCVNGAMLLVEVIVAVETFRAVLGSAPPTSPRAWLAAYVAVWVSGLVSAVTVTLIIALFQAELHPRDLTQAVLTSSGVSLLMGTIALVAVNALQRSTTTGWLLLAAAAVILICYRAYAALSGRHAALARLYGFTGAISSTHEPDEVLSQLLLSAREIARAEHAEIVFAPALPGGGLTRLTLDENGHLQRDDAGGPEGAAERTLDPVHAQVLETGEAVLLPHGAGLARHPEWRRYLRRTGRRETLAVPLRNAQQGPAKADGAEAGGATSPGVTGSLLVAGRIGQVRTFDGTDLRLVETMANHADLALRNGWLINDLTHAVRHDALTGLVNRSYLHQQLSNVLGEIRGGRRAGAAVMICDLNGFKDVNDALGHQMGDVLLQQVALRAAAALRPGDVLARLGGDEFAILLPNSVTAEEAASVGERVLNAVAQPIKLADVEVSVGMSIGISLAPRHGVETSGLLKRADLAMYAAKATNRGVRLWDSGMGRTDTQQLTIAGELRRALESGEIEIQAQPIASLVSGEVTAVEILPRWEHAERGLLMPDEFMAVAASSGLASELARHLVSAALEAGASWRSRGAELGLVVNLPARAFSDASTPEAVAGLLESHEFPARLLTLEINESSVVTEPKRSLPYLNQLVELGVRIGVDGFGNGHPALTHLRRMPIGQVRIDERFVRRVDRDSSDEAIVRSIVELASKFGVQVVAEGVEHQREWETLRRLGCPQAQGPWLARPLPLQSFWDWFCADDPRGRRLLNSGRLPQARDAGDPREPRLEGALGSGADRIDVDVSRTGDPLRGKAS